MTLITMAIRHVMVETILETLTSTVTDLCRLELVIEDAVIILGSLMSV